MGIHRCIVGEGSSASILSSSAWKFLGSPKLVSATSEFLDFDERPTWNPWTPPMGPINSVFPLESDLVVCKTSSPGICELSSLGFMDVELPSYEAILEDMIKDFRPLPELENIQFYYQRIPWPRPSNGIYLGNYYA
jgi:hypothetical protein